MEGLREEPSSRKRKGRSTFVAIGLGGNLGTPRRAFRTALRDLAPHVRSLEVSPLYETRPVGPPQPDFLNAVAIGRTRLSARELLSLLQALEARAGRLRTEPDGPRTLDLDLLLYGNRTLRRADLRVPHPRIASRRFVLQPLADLCPRRVVPGLGRTVGTLLRLSPPGGVRRLRSVL